MDQARPGINMRVGTSQALSIIVSLSYRRAQEPIRLQKLCEVFEEFSILHGAHLG